jgi:hypothetical protein
LIALDFVCTYDALRVGSVAADFPKRRRKHTKRSCGAAAEPVAVRAERIDRPTFFADPSWLRTRRLAPGNLQILSVNMQNA